MRVIIDTNVLVSGLLWHGAPHALPEEVRGGTLVLISSPALLDEIADVMGRSKFDLILTRSSTSRERALAELRQLAEVVEPLPLPQPVCRDPDDDQLLGLALAAQVDLIISGDDDLLALERFQSIPIVSASQALLQIKK